MGKQRLKASKNSLRWKMTAIVQFLIPSPFYPALLLLWKYKKLPRKGFNYFIFCMQPTTEWKKWKNHSSTFAPQLPSKTKHILTQTCFVLVFEEKKMSLF